VTPVSNVVSGGGVVVEGEVVVAPAVVVVAGAADVVVASSSPHAVATRAKAMRRLASTSHRFLILCSSQGLMIR
jgi:hypothetical protein